MSVKVAKIADPEQFQFGDFIATCLYCGESIPIPSPFFMVERIRKHMDAKHEAVEAGLVLADKDKWEIEWPAPDGPLYVVVEEPTLF